METNEINKPIKEIRAGFVKASIWENDFKLENGEVIKVKSLNLAKNIKDKEDNWKQTNNYNKSDLLYLKVVIDKAINEIILNKYE